MKKYSSGSFIDAAVRVYGSEADTINSFPATVYADGENAAALIKGNLQQSGTPTPSTPIYPSECGDLETTGEHSGQYKIPILCGNTTTPVYLGEVQSTRQINQLVLTGDEVWNTLSSPTYTYYTKISQPINISPICSHFVYVNGIAYLINNRFTFTNDNIAFKYSSSATVDDFRTYLAQQYANGTPVCVWYVLATETTGIVNEPLRKIGDYSDSVAAAAIPTTAGSQSINIDTTLKPSSVDLTYTGWHDHSDKKRSGGAWV